MIKIFIADPHEIMRQRLKMLLGCVSGLQVVGQSGNANDTVSHVREGSVDVLLLDPSLSPYGDIELVRQIRDEAPELNILILTKSEDEQYSSRVMRAGADAHLTKTSELNHLIAAIKIVGSAGPQGSRTRMPSLSYA
ncbi:response regulator [Massilia niastensis]|uniref:response regulator n=1 Tax=Massilia niastensis TaxID=544911 RepID=UPI0012EBAF4F|nr:response regulator transcription factor [Massilia niastensis]